MTKVTFIVPRIEKMRIPTVAAVTAEVGAENLRQDNGFRAALERALTKWFKTTEAGYEAWQQSCEDFNVGDLAAQLPAEGALKEFLELEKIFNLEIQTFDGGGCDWLYDAVLGDGERQEEEEEEE